MSAPSYSIPELKRFDHHRTTKKQDPHKPKAVSCLRYANGQAEPILFTDTGRTSKPKEVRIPIRSLGEGLRKST